jgi:cytidyltransferase-like protein
MVKKPVVVAVSGAFDPLHVGHVRYIRAAAELGDKLVVILNSDDFLLRKKGFVFWPFDERKEIIESIEGVDEVVAAVDKDQTVRKTLELVKPNIFAKGGDAGPESIPEAATCRKVGCKLVTNVGRGQVHPNGELTHRLEDLAAERPKALRIACPYCEDHPMLRDKCKYCKGTGKIEVGKAD